MDKRFELNRIVKESIVQSLFMLMRQKPFSDITVTDIITKAGVARASYYRNFESKEGIIRDYLYEIILNFKKTIPCNQSGKMTYDNLLRLFTYIAEYSEILRALFNSGLSGLFPDLLNLYFQDTQEEILSGKFNIWALYAYSGALSNIISKWIEGNMEQSPEEIAASFYSIWKMASAAK